MMAVHGPDTLYLWKAMKEFDADKFLEAKQQMIKEKKAMETRQKDGRTRNVSLTFCLLNETQENNSHQGSLHIEGNANHGWE